MPDTNVPMPMPGAKPSAPDRPEKSVDKRNEKSGPDPSDAGPTPAQHEQARQTLRQWLGVGEPITGTDAKGAPKTATEAVDDAVASAPGKTSDY
jgi:hypothetical protein